MKKRSMILKLACLCVLVLACSQKTQQAEKKPMTTAERDSAIGESSLPGAGVMKKALEQSDSAKARSEREDDMTDDMEN